MAQSPDYSAIGQVHLLSEEDPNMEVSAHPMQHRGRTIVKVVLAATVLAGLFAVSRQLAARSPPVQAFPEEFVGLSETADSFRGSKDDLEKDLVGLDAYKCVPGSCSVDYWHFTEWHFYFPDAYVPSQEDCARAVAEANDPRITGFFHGDVDLKCIFVYDGWCNIFEDNFWSWNPLSSFGGYSTCTKSVNSVSLSWKFQFCTEQPQNYTVSKGINNTEAWAEEVMIEAGIVQKVKSTANRSQSAETSLSATPSQTVHLMPGEEKQQCLWQWQATGKGGPTGSTYAFDYAEYAVTPGPEVEPQCIPGQFSPTDVDKQTCIEAKYRAPWMPSSALGRSGISVGCLLLAHLGLVVHRM